MTLTTETATSTATKATTATDDAITYCSNRSFHQCIHLPATSQHPRLRVTFATTTNFDNDAEEELPVILFCHPMGAARYMIYGFEHLAKKMGVRMVIIDR